jgi:hypothetical protein
MASFREILQSGRDTCVSGLTATRSQDYDHSVHQLAEAPKIQKSIQGTPGNAFKFERTSVNRIGQQATLRSYLYTK